MVKEAHPTNNIDPKPRIIKYNSNGKTKKIKRNGKSTKF